MLSMFFRLYLYKMLRRMLYSRTDTNRRHRARYLSFNQ